MKNLTRITLFALLFLLIHCGVQPLPKPVFKPSNANPAAENESKEFADLFAKDQFNKTQETADVLNYLLNDDDPQDPNTAIVIENTSSCDLIVRMLSLDGHKIYNFPIPKNAKNHFRIAKGNYTLKSNVCDAKYYSQKTINESVIVKILRP